jgi:hypothetical protein
VTFVSLGSKVAECFVLSAIIGQVPVDLAKLHEVNESCKFRISACNHCPSACNNRLRACNNWPSAWNDWPSAWNNWLGARRDC